MITKITNVDIYTMKDKECFFGELLIDEDRILEIGSKIYSECDRTVDGKGGMLFPAFIDAHNHMGLIPEGYGSEYEDLNEKTNPITADLRVIDSFTPTDQAIEDAARGGVMIHCVLTGSANPVGGLSFIFKYTKSNLVGDKIIKENNGLKMATGENPKRIYGEKKMMPCTRMGTAALIRKFLYDGKSYILKKQKALEEGKEFCDRDAKMESAQMVLEKKIPARIHCHRSEDILTAIRIMKEFDINIIIEHATEFYKVKEEVKNANIPIILGPIMSARTKVELKDLTYNSFKIAIEEGILFACMSDHNVFPCEVLRLQAGMAVSYGADEWEMLKSLTINPARILNIEDQYGTIDIGKAPYMCIWEGHPFDARSKVIWNNTYE